MKTGLFPNGGPKRKAVWRVFERYREIQMRREDGETREAGFTLIELLIVIVVLGILAAIVIFSLTGVTGQSKAAACNSDAKTVEVAVDAYNAEIGTFPVNSGSLLSAAVTGGPYLHSWPGTGNGYSITLDTAQDGTVFVNSVAYDSQGGTNACTALG
jgi:type II secretion system protein G